MGNLQDLDQAFIENLGLSRRTFHALHRNGVFTVGKLKELLKKKKLGEIYFIGQKSLDEVSSALNEFYKETHNPSLEEKNLGNTLSLDETQTSDIEFAHIEILNLHTSIRGALIKNGIQTIGDLRNTNDKALLNINRIGPKVLVEIRQALESINIEPNKHISMLNIERKKTPFDSKSTSITWAEIVQSYFESEKESYTYVLLSRFGLKSKTFEEIAGELGVTRSRVQQIQVAVIYHFLKYIRFAGSAQFLEKIYEIFSDYGEDLSLKKFKQKLRERNLLGNFSSSFMAKRISKIDLFETLICWLNLLSNSRYSQQPIEFPVDVKSLMNSGSISIRDSKKIGKITPKLRRKIKRQVNFTGGINIKESSKILSEDGQTTKLVLQELNLTEVIDSWYALKTYDAESNKSRIPLQIAGLKMLTIKPAIHLDTFYGGLRRYINRFYPTIAPINVIVYSLELLGFEINSQQMVSSNLNGENILSRSEKSFVSAITKNDGVASFIEIAEEFSVHKLSLPAVSVTLKRSPIVEKVDDGFYKLRGIDISWQQIEIAKKRQKRFSQDEEITHGLDGIVRVRLTVNSYAYLTGVVGSYSIKGLAGSWAVIYNHESFGDAKMDESYLWGLPKIFKKLNIHIGDRIELSFNTWNRNLAVEKVNHGNTQ
jgi:RNA polymerase alpha subunit